MSIHQKTFTLPPFPRGFHLITQQIQNKISVINSSITGIAHIFIHHTSAGITINENADPTVRMDFEKHFNVMVPENATYFKHTLEGSDDMPAHIKSSLLGHDLTIPISKGKLLLGIWQGIYLCEHRNDANSREFTITLLGV